MAHTTLRKLSWDDACALRLLAHRTYNQVPRTVLARAFGVYPTALYQLLNGESYVQPAGTPGARNPARLRIKLSSTKLAGLTPAERRAELLRQAFAWELAHPVEYERYRLRVKDQLIRDRTLASQRMSIAAHRRPRRQVQVAA